MFASSISTSSSIATLHLLTRHLSTAHHCFVSLPRGTFAQQLQARNSSSTSQQQGCLVILVEWNDGGEVVEKESNSSTASSAVSSSAVSSSSSSHRRVYVGWLGEYHADDDPAQGMGTIGVPTQFAAALSIPHNARVRITLLPDSHSQRHHTSAAASSSSHLVTFEPLTSDDWEILELNTHAIEYQLLSQIQVFNPGQIFPLFLGSAGGLKIRLKYVPQNAGSAAATPFVKLALQSEISIVPKPRPSRTTSTIPTIASGNPPPIARLCVQPRETDIIELELTDQQRVAEEATEKRKREMREEWWRQQQLQDFARESEISFDSVSGNFTSTAAASPPSSFNIAPVESAPCTLLLPHYIHLSSSTMSYLDLSPHDLVVLSHTFKPKTAPPAAERPQETITIVARVNIAKCVMEEGEAKKHEANPVHYILISKSLRLALHTDEFSWLHVQRLSAHSLIPHPESPLKQSLCVRESMQRIQNIRLKELQIRINDAPSTSAATSSLSPQQAEEDAQRVSEAFITYVRSSISNDGNALPIPFVNGGVIELHVATRDRAVNPKEQRTNRRYFAVCFNEPDLIATKQNSLSLTQSSAPTSFLDTSPPVEAEQSSSASALRVSMATSFFLIQAPQMNAKSGKRGRKSVVPSLPLPVLHSMKYEYTVQLGEWEDRKEWVNENDQIDTTQLNDNLHAFPPFNELGGSPEYHRTVTSPLIRYLRTALCSDLIRERNEILRRSSGGSNDEVSSIPLGGMMIVGSHGVGKSALVHSLCRTLRFSTNPIGVLAQTIWVDCKNYISTKLSEFTSFFSSILLHIRRASPGGVVLVLEDLDRLLPKIEQDDTPDSLRTGELCEIVSDLLGEWKSQYPDAPVALISICQSTSTHHPILNTLFPHLLTISNPSSADRISIFQSILNASGMKLHPKLDLHELGRKTEGYTASDLKQLSVRCLHEYKMRIGAVQDSTRTRHEYSTALVPVRQHDRGLSTSSSSSSISSSSSPRNHSAIVPYTASPQPSPSASPAPINQLESIDLQNALRGFVPYALKDLPSSGTTKDDDDGWNSIGGMTELKEILLDTFDLPVRYAEFFSRAPLKLRSGLLLFGPSGCGKTLIASHIAARCGLNFISVKGPELLNKYIGSSEGNVREVFQRARNAAPALLFFDEMESIVPVRGNDSTGVTDRVVNQFLCELDGVEGKLSGAKQFYVLGASSRPDRIDPALLRPGRLDKSVYVGLPTRDERLDMLRCMTRKLQLDDDVDLSYIADHTEFYTPADLQAILTSVQSTLVQEVIAQKEQELKGGKSSKSAPLQLPRVTQRHILTAFHASQPSTSSEDREQYDAIYSKFRENREDPMKKGHDIGSAIFDPDAPQKQSYA